MSRFSRHHHDFDYGSGGVSNLWDTRTAFIDADDDNDDNDEAGRYSRIALGGRSRRVSASVSVIGYGDLELRPRTRTARDRDRDTDRNRIRVRRRDGSHRATLKPSLSAGLTSTLMDYETENLKQRLRLDRSPPPAPPTPGTYSHQHRRDQHNLRARSLSLSRLSAGYSDEEPDPVVHGEGWDGATVVPEPPGYYRHPRLSLSSPRVALAGAGWPLASSRPGTRSPSLERERERERGRYERGYQILPVVPPYAAPHGNEDELRMRLGGELPNPRVPSRKGRSESFERYCGAVNGRKRSPGTGGRVRAASKYRGVRPQYNQVHALILTWSFHDLRTEDYTAPPSADYVSLEEETARLRDTLESYGYTVHEFLIPMHRSVESLKAKLKQFCRYAADDTLLIIYYHGHGALNDDNELVFSSHDHPDNPEWSQAAAAELYAALLSGDACATHGRRDKYQELLKKYERYRPVASLKWDAIRSTILSAACDVLLILDCCAAGGANLRHIDWQPPPGTEGYTKHLFAACGFESSTSDDMTAAMCEVLDEWVPPSRSVSRSSPRPQAGLVGSDVGESGGGVNGNSAGGPVGGGQVFLTTKRLHQLMEAKLQKRSVGSQPIFKQLLPQDPEQYITLPNLREREMERGRGRDLKMAERRGRRGYILA
ncbi:nipped-B-like protein B [Achaetomium macrosporum]|uniref:Nipped-B-like protein B n=1 Tax=Achaetomium macrosporum TaxID=79813 RepID=A0AAN7C266_9PEZI|nr:nipped-B-like protein B [Achaetomium macrosporum]